MKKVNLASALFAILLITFVALQYNLWFSNTSIASVISNKDAIKKQLKVNGELLSQQDYLLNKAASLKNDSEILEDYARYNLGMVGKNEVYFQFS